MLPCLTLIAGVLVLGIQSYHAPVTGLQDRSGRTPLIELAPDGRLTLNAAAIQMLDDDAASQNMTIGEFAACFRFPVDRLTHLLEHLAREGVRFIITVRQGPGVHTQICGEPVGAISVLRLTDVSELVMRAEKAENRLNIALRAIDEAGLAAIHLDARGRQTWRSAKATSVSAEVMRRFTEREGDGEPFSWSEGGLSGVWEQRRYDDPSGGVLHVGRDVTAAARAEARLREVVTTVSTAFAELNVGLMVFDSKHRLILFNPHVVDLTGLTTLFLATRPELREILDRMRDLRRVPDEADYLSWRERLVDAVWTSGEQDAAGHTEVWHLPDGGVLRLTARGQKDGLSMFLEDRTQSIALQRRSLAERQVHVAATETLDEAVMMIGPDGAVRLVNRMFRQMWRTGDFDPVGAPLSEVLAHCRDLAVDVEFFDQVQRRSRGEDRHTSLSADMRLKSGRIVAGRVTLAPDGGLIATFSDVTERVDYQNALRERANALEIAAEMRAAVVDQISHRMRAPLNVVLGYGGMLKVSANEKLSAAERRQLDYILDAAREVAASLRKIGEVLDFSDDIAASAQQPRDLEQMLRQIISKTEDMSSRSEQIVLSTRLSRDVDVAHVAGHISRVFANMLISALENSDERDTVSVSADANDSSLVLDVRHAANAAGPGADLATSLAARLASVIGGSVQSIDEENGARKVRFFVPLDTTRNTLVAANQNR